MYKVLIFLITASFFYKVDSHSAEVKQQRYQTFSSEEKIMNDLKNLFNEKMPEMMGAFKSMSTFKMNMLENSDAYHIDAELPGVKKGDIKLSLKDGTLTISGEKRSYLEDKKDNYSLVERTNGKFSRSITLPSDVDQSKVTSKLEDGVLKIDIGRLKKTRPINEKEIEIQ